MTRNAASKEAALAAAAATALPMRPRPYPEIDLSACKREGASYRVLPPTYVPPKCTGRSDLDRSVLNDRLVSVHTGSEDYGRHRAQQPQRRILFDDTFFRVEDDRYDLDVAIEQNCAAMREIFLLMRRRTNQTPKQNPGSAPDDSSAASPTTASAAPPSAASASTAEEGGISVVGKHVIARMYGNRGAELLKVLSDRPDVVGPIVLQRIRQKTAEWLWQQREMNRHWRAVHERHFRREQDAHIAPSRRCIERRALMPAALLSQIRHADSSAVSTLMLIPDVHCDIATLFSFRGVPLDAAMASVDHKTVALLDRFVAPFFAASSSPSSLFFGSAAFFVFFRIYAVLYERLAIARHIAASTTGHTWSNILNSPMANLWLRRFRLHRQSHPDGSSAVISSEAEQFNPLHRFLEAVMARKTDVLDQQGFEEDCSLLFGPGLSFQLFQVPSLLSLLAHHATAIVTSDGCERLLALHSHRQEHLAEISEAAYREAAEREIGDEVFSFSFAQSTLTITLISRPAFVASSPTVASTTSVTPAEELLPPRAPQLPPRRAAAREALTALSSKCPAGPRSRQPAAKRPSKRGSPTPTPPSVQPLPPPIPEPAASHAVVAVSPMPQPKLSEVNFDLDAVIRDAPLPPPHVKGLLLRRNIARVRAAGHGDAKFMCSDNCGVFAEVSTKKLCFVFGDVDFMLWSRPPHPLRPHIVTLPASVFKQS